MRAWTQSEIKLLRELRSQGKSFREIAGRLGRSESAAAKRGGVIGLRNKVEWSADAITLLRCMIAEGRTRGEIAKHFGCTRGALSCKLWELRLRTINHDKPVRVYKPRPLGSLPLEAMRLKRVDRQMQLVDRLYELRRSVA